MKLIINYFFLYCLFMTSLSQAFTDPTKIYQDIFKFGGYKLVSEKRIERTIFEYNYKLTLTNISATRLKGVTIFFPPIAGASELPALVSLTDHAGLLFGTLESGETKQSFNTLTLIVDRSLGETKIEILDEPLVAFSQPIVVSDTNNNQFTLYISPEPLVKIPTTPGINILLVNPTMLTHPELADLVIKEDQNPTNIPNIENFPFITKEFIEVTFPEEFANTPVNIEIKYNKIPYRLLLLKNNEIEWATFINHFDTKTAAFTAGIDKNNKVIFALIEQY